MTSLPRYKCHKIVEAAPILSMREATRFDLHGARPMNEGWEVTVSLPGPKEEAPTTVFHVPFDTFSRSGVRTGDYLVKYTDQPDREPFWSWSPKAVFEKGYTLEA